MREALAGGGAAVVIGRNEGERLLRCLRSLSETVDHIVYVDSGSDDGSIAAAAAMGAEVLELDMSQPFTAARARNAGIARLLEADDPPRFVQFIDGDCELQPGWITEATTFLAKRPQAAAVAGRLREQHPEASVYNRLAEAEWNQPAGRTDATGGIAMMRMEALAEVGGFNPALIAGEEPDLCLRLRRVGWEIWRIDEEMALHDIAMTRFSQWWRRARRAGHTYAEGVALHGRGPERYCLPELRRALLWGAALPGVSGLGAILGAPWALLLLLLLPAQVIRLKSRGESWQRAGFLVLGKFPEAQGAIGYGLRRLIGRTPPLIEYK